MIGIISYGMGNVGSIQNMLARLGIASNIVSQPEVLADCDKLILPGVGAFDSGMNRLRATGFAEALTRCVGVRRIPLLGICLGMQLLFEKSEEGSLPGLGLIQGECKKFKFDLSLSLKIPHMQWNTVKFSPGAVLQYDLPAQPRFYFVHSYHPVCAHPQEVIGWTHYGYLFASSVRRDHIYGVQFHPEKSHKHGMKLLSNFALRA